MKSLKTFRINTELYCYLLQVQQQGILVYLKEELHIPFNIKWFKSMFNVHSLPMTLHTLEAKNIKYQAHI